MKLPQDVLIVGATHPLAEALKKELCDYNQFVFHEWQPQQQLQHTQLPENLGWGMLLFSNIAEGMAQLKAVQQQFPTVVIVGITHYIDDDERLILMRWGMSIIATSNELTGFHELIQYYDVYKHSLLFQHQKMIQNPNLEFRIIKKRPLSELTQKLSPKLRKIVELLHEERTFTALNLSTYLGCKINTIYNQMRDIYEILNIENKAQLLALLDECVKE